MKNLNFKKIKTIKDLWDENHINFKKWMYGTIAAIVFISLMFLIQLLINVILKDLIIDSIINNVKNGNNTNSESLPSRETVLLQILIHPLLLSILTIWVSVMFILSFINAEKNKTYEKISSGASVTTAFMSLFSIYQIIVTLVTIINGRNHSLIWILIQLPTVLVFISSPFLWYFVTRKSTMIKRTFLNIKHLEQMQKLMQDENIKKFFNLFNIDLDEVTNNHQNMSSSTNEGKSKMHEAQEVKSVDPILSKLETLSDEKLSSMAEKLNIYDFSNLPRTELIKKIYENIKK